MTDETTFTEPTSREEEQSRMCDFLIDRAARILVEDHGVSIPMLLDRLLTFAGAHAASRQGSPATARAFRTMAENIDRGVFHPVTGEVEPEEQRH